MPAQRTGSGSRSIRAPLLRRMVAAGMLGRKSGWVYGQNLLIEGRCAEGQSER
jgi:hypothetical protein